MSYNFKASRLTSGNLFFRDQIEITEDQVIIFKNKLIGNNRSIINRANIGSVSVNTSIFATIIIETRGGERYVSNGFYRSDAKQIQQILFCEIIPIYSVYLYLPIWIFVLSK